MKLEKGTERTREFYEAKGWKRAETGRLEDTEMFGTRVDGPIRKRLHAQRYNRILKEFGSGTKDFVELGCGGNPTLELQPLWGHYTGVDFSQEGLAQSARKLKELKVAHQLVQADITSLPIPDRSADAVFSAHVLYHIDTVEGQAAALREAVRILKPKGTAVFVGANPFPLLFPFRLLARLIASVPGSAALARRLGRNSPLPYLPLPPRWFRRQLEVFGDVTVSVYAIHSTWFNQVVSEEAGFGRIAWKVVAAIESRYPSLAAYLGNYVVIRLSRESVPIEKQGR